MQAVLLFYVKSDESLSTRQLVSQLEIIHKTTLYDTNVMNEQRMVFKRNLINLMQKAVQGYENLH